MRKASTWLQRKYSWTWYADLVDKCSNPDCTSSSNLEVHHIVPLFQGGSDDITNCVVLCGDCHNRLGINLHYDWESYYTLLKYWKIKTDNDVIGDMPVKYKEELINDGLIIGGVFMRQYDITYKNIDIKADIYSDMLKMRKEKIEAEKRAARIGFFKHCKEYVSEEISLVGGNDQCGA